MRAARVIAALAACASCELFEAPQRYPYGAIVFVVTSSDAETLRRLACVQVDLRLGGEGAPSRRQRRCFRGRGHGTFPAVYWSVRASERDADRGAADVRAELIGGASFTQRGEFQIGAYGATAAVFSLHAGCVGVTCPEGLTCGGDGRCTQPVRRDDLRAWDPSSLPPEQDLELLFPDDAGASVDAAADVDRADAAPDATPDARDATIDACASCDDDGLCTDLTSDPSHCGACGRRCGLREACRAGACASVAVTGLAAAVDRTCALMSDGTVRCWGSNTADRALGVSTGASTIPSPVRVAGASGVSQLAMGDAFVCMLIGGRVRCNGAAPEGVAAIEGASALAAGHGSVCAAGASEVRCVGRNDFGQLGDGTTTDRAALVAVAGLAPGRATALSAGYFSACALVAGRVACWGMNEWDQLGGAAGPVRCGAGQPCCGASGVRCRPSAVSVDGLDVVDSVGTQGLRGYRGLVAGMPVYTQAGVTCVVERARSVRCWGDGRLVGIAGRGGVNVAAPGAAIPSLRATDVVMGLGFACALEEGGTVACWGANNHCQLAQRSDGGTEVPTPQRVAGLTGVRALAAGGEHVCALRDDGAVLCWGQNASGQLGQGMTSDGVCAPSAVRW